MKYVTYTRRLIASEDDFKKFARKYHIAMIATLFLLRFFVLGNDYEIFDWTTFEISKVSFRWTMGVLAALMASTYAMGSNLRDYYDAIGSTERIFEERAMFYGFLTLMFFSLFLFGFWGIIWLSVSPPIVLLVLQVAKGKATKIQHTD